MSFNEYWQAEQQRRAVAAAMTAVRADEPATREAFLRTLVPTQLFVPVAELPTGHEIGDAVTKPDVALRLALFNGSDGKVYLSAFTSEANLHRNFPPEQPFVVLPFPVLAQMVEAVQAGGLLLDHNAPASAMLPPPLLQQAAQLAAGAGTPSPSVAPTALRIGPMPRVVSQREVAALDQYLRGQPGVVLAYLFGLIQPNNQAVLSVALGTVAALPAERVQQLAAELGALFGPLGVTVMDGRLATLLARQPGALRFELTPPGGATSAGKLPPTAPAPPPEA